MPEGMTTVRLQSVTRDALRRFAEVENVPTDDAAVRLLLRRERVRRMASQLASEDLRPDELAWHDADTG